MGATMVVRGLHVVIADSAIGYETDTNRKYCDQITCGEAKNKSGEQTCIERDDEDDASVKGEKSEEGKSRGESRVRSRDKTA